ncbi:SpoIIE family protein phosphatase [Streptomyces sp. NPDC056738]|uniref:SpoIIE family protein phosphatase n=1 Tax=Streptomyces sp. NPDC056738 TaxID=3345933 RepID=UPI00367E7FCB
MGVSLSFWDRRRGHSTASGGTRPMTARLPSARLVVDERATVVQWSPEAEQLLGYSEKEALGRPVSLFLDQEQGDGPAGEQIAARHRSGRRVMVRATVDTMAQPGEPLHWVVRLSTVSDTVQDEIDTALLRALLTDSPLGVQVVDGDLRLLRLNLSGVGVRGAVGHEAIGRHVRDIAPGLVDETVEAKLRHTIESGQPLSFLHRGRPPSDPTHDHVYSVTLLPLRDSAGRIVGALVASQDVTEREQARARLDLMVEAGARIGTTLEVRTTAQELGAAAVPAVADIVTVDVLDGVLYGEAYTPGPVGEQTRLRRVAFHTARDLGARAAYDTGELVEYLLPAHIAALTELHPILVPHLRHGETPADDRRTARIHADGAHSLLAVPLTARGVLLGLASFYRAQAPDPYDEGDLVLASELCARAAVCLDNARQYTREHNAAQALQRTLLPRSAPSQSAVEVAWRHESTQSPGDWFDVIPLSGARVALVVGRMAGEGIDAVAAMGQLCTATNTLAAQDLAPDELLGRLHDMVTGRSDETADDPRAASARNHMQGASCLYAVYDPVSRRCTLARAGHPAAVVVDPQGRPEICDIPEGPLLGTSHPPYRSVDMQLPEGTSLGLFNTAPAPAKSAGPSPAAQILCQILSSDPRRDLSDSCEAFIRAGKPADGGSLVLLARTRVLSADRVATWTLPPDPAVVAEARAMSLQQLADWGLGDLDFSTELIVSELVTNAIRYGAGPVGLRLIRDRGLICEVSDSSSTAPHLRYAYETDEGGRGLFLVAQIAHRWGTRYSARGKTIWAEQVIADPVTTRPDAMSTSQLEPAKEPHEDTSPPLPAGRSPARRSGKTPETQGSGRTARLQPRGFRTRTRPLPKP